MEMCIYRPWGTRRDPSATAQGRETPERPVLALAPLLRCCSPADGLAPPVFTPMCPAIQPQLHSLLQDGLPNLGVFVHAPRALKGDPTFITLMSCFLH